MSIVTSPVSSATVSQRAEEEEDELLPHSMAFPARGPVLGGVAHTQTNDDDANENGTRAGAPSDISTTAAAVQPSATTEGASSDYESDSCEDEQDTAAAADEIGGRSDGDDDGDPDADTDEGDDGYHDQDQDEDEGEEEERDDHDDG